MEFRYYVIRRVLMQIIVIWGMLSVSFFAMKAIPGDPIVLLIGEAAYAQYQAGMIQEYVKEVKALYGLDKPLWEQYIYYVGNVMQGKLGRSIRSYNQEVTSLLRTTFPATIELTLLGFLIAMAIAIPSGIISALHRGGKVDQVARIYSIFGVSAPGFWWGLLLLYVFYFKFRVLPGFGRLSWMFNSPPFVTGMYTIDSLLEGRFDKFIDALSHLILPALTIGITSCGLTTRLTRSSLLEVLHKEYVLTARMKGLGERVVLFRHILRNSLTSVVTYVGFMFGGMLGGSFFVEWIFNYHGMGRLGIDSFLAKDFPAVLGIGVFTAIVFTTSNLIVDLLYGLIDPRVRYG